MAKCRPAKWVPWALLGAGLPLLAAYTTGTTTLTEDIRNRASKALSASENTTWAKLDSTARDFTLSGTAPSQEALDLAVKTVAGSYGVRSITNTAQVAPPITLLAPTVDSMSATTATPEIKGTWQEGVATTLTVTVGETPYKLGESPELTTLAGNWLLKLTKPLPEGDVNVTVESSDGKTVMAAAAPGKLTIDLPDLPKLPAPTVENYLGNTARPTFKGTWPEVAAKAVEKNLQVKLGETKFVLGTNPELKTDGAGNWQLTPTQPLAEGEITVMPGIVGADGKWQTAEAPAKAVIDITPPVIPAVEKPAADVKWPFAITGKWPEMAGNTLAAILAGKTYEANKDDNLKTDGQGGFSFNPKVELAPGSYDVDIAVKDAAGNLAKQTLTAAIVIPEPPKVEEVVPPKAAAPVAVAPDAKWPYAITGSWDEKPGNVLTATVDGRKYTANSGAALSTDKAGNFTFQPAAKFAPGSHDVDFTTTNAKGEAVTATAKAAIVIPEPAKVEAPVPAPVAATPMAVPADAKWPYAITGKWDEKPGNVLTATVDGHKYTVNSGAALSSDKAGNFTFQPSAKFAPGSYDVDFTTTNAKGEAATVTAKAAIVVPVEIVPTPPPPQPEPLAVAVIDPVPTSVWPYALTGSWDERAGNSLSANVNGRTYMLGRGAALSSTATGKFSFAPSAKFDPGSYDVDFITTDRAGVKQVTTAKAAIVIPKPAGVIPPPPPAVEIPSPTVNSQLDLTGAPVITGRWPNSLATNLNITLDGITYKLGVDGNLRTKDDVWTLFPRTAVKDGSYDVVAEATDAAGNMGMDVTSNELEVDATQPAAPTVMTASGDSSPDHLSGTWDEAGAKSLKITVPQINLTAVLGAEGSPLTSDGAGKWRLNLATPLPAGSYNVIAETTDERGRVQTDVSEGEVVIVAKGAPVPPPPPPYDCVAVMNRIANVFPIRFEFDLTDITKPFDLSVSQYAALLKDPRCTSLNIEIKGHADFRGTEIYNMGLSERRAVVIMGMLEKAGVDAQRMSIKALGESQPLDPAETDDARAKNRRVEITVKP